LKEHSHVDLPLQELNLQNIQSYANDRIGAQRPEPYLTSNLALGSKHVESHAKSNHETNASIPKSHFQLNKHQDAAQKEGTRLASSLTRRNRSTTQDPNARRAIPQQSRRRRPERPMDRRGNHWSLQSNHKMETNR
jgi:hypothetical protein